MKFYLKTFGCQQNYADSNKIENFFISQGYKKTTTYKSADLIVLNTCMVRESAENRVYGLINNIKKLNKEKQIIITGCMAGIVLRDEKIKKIIEKKIPLKIDFLPTSQIINKAENNQKKGEIAYISISNGCNNFCSYCIVPYTRGKEVSRPFDEIVLEAQKAFDNGYKKIMLLGQNVNSYGSDLKSKINPVFVKHLGKNRIPTLFPQLLEKIAQIKFEEISFMSSNPWDFSDELIATIAKNSNISRTIHLPLQSGDTNVLSRMNRWYTKEEYLDLINKIKKNIPNIKFTTDIIVGFCGETDNEFENTVEICKKVNFEKAFVSIYSPRIGTLSYKKFNDNVPFKTKRQRWLILEKLINFPHLKKINK